MDGENKEEREKTKTFPFIKHSAIICLLEMYTDFHFEWMKWMEIMCE